MALRRWTYENDEDNLEQWIIRDTMTDHHDIVAVVPKTGDEDYDNEVIFRHATLIAAAPDLLDALRGLVDLCQEPSEWVDEEREVYNRAVAAIGKAVKGDI